MIERTCERRGRSPIGIIRQGERMNERKLRELDREIRDLETRIGYETRDSRSGRSSRRLRLRYLDVQQRMEREHETQRCLQRIRRKLREQL